jgi:hypothetical protein
MAETSTTLSFHRWEAGSERSASEPLPLGAVARGRGLRRTRLTRRDLAREYDDWLARSSAGHHDVDARDAS